MNDEAFDGVWVRTPAGLWHRLVLHGRQQLARELRWVEPEADGVTVLETFLASRLGGPARSLPTPSAEPGDLLVKVGRAEFWTFTVHGWRELAPLELQPAFEPECGPQSVGEEPHFGDRGARMKGLGSVAASMGPSAGMSAPLPPLREAAVELGILAGAIRRTIEVAEAPDLGVDDRLRAFAEGLETAQRLVVELEQR